MQTINGKLIVEEQSELEQLKPNLENLVQQFEHLELQITAVNKQDKIEYLKQLTYIQLSLHKLERIYNRLVFTTILTAFGLASWYIWLGFNQNSAPVKLANSSIPITSIKAATDH